MARPFPLTHFDHQRFDLLLAALRTIARGVAADHACALHAASQANSGRRNLRELRTMYVARRGCSQ